MINVKSCYQFDALNLLNLLTKNKEYTGRHTDACQWITTNLPQSLYEDVTEIVTLLETDMLSPYFALVFSSLPNFESLDIVESFSDIRTIHKYYSNTIYYNEATWKIESKAIGKLSRVIACIIDNRFKQYWESEFVNVIERKKELVLDRAKRLELSKMINSMKPFDDDITLYLQGLASPFGIKICGPNYISDVSCDETTILRIAIHEMFHPPYSHKKLHADLKKVYENSFIQRIFNENNGGYSVMEGFIEENVVEAMELAISLNAGLIDNGYKYLKTHDSGSHVFSVVLLEKFLAYQKRDNETFEDYLKNILEEIKTDDIESDYNRLMRDFAG